MKHLGDITKINGAEIEPVDVITGGSPCQDISCAGKRSGMSKVCPNCGWSVVGNAEESVCPECGTELEYTRSGLFMEQIRVMKEMREHDRRTGRSGIDVRCRYGIWENVPGALSSNKGADFQAVLTEFARVSVPNAPPVPMPDGGKWPKSGVFYDSMGRFSIAYRIHDAQYWGVPQRRRRLALVADFNGLTAAEILFDPQLRREAEDSEPDQTVADSGAQSGPEVQFERESVSRHFESSEAQGQGTAAATESGTGSSSISFQERAGKPGGGKGILIQEERTGALSTLNIQSVLAGEAIPIEGNGQRESHRGNGDGKTVCTLTGDHQNRVTDYTAVVTSYQDTTGTLTPGAHPGSYNGQDAYTDMLVAGTFQNTGQGWRNESDVGATVRTPCGGDSTKANLVAAVDCRNATENPDVNGTLQAKEQGQNLNSNNVVRTAIPTSVVRRLTPLECTRLQGLPDGWVEIGEWTDSKGKARKESDSPKYKALGNSLALPFWAWLARRICAQYESKVTMGSLFDGVGAFCLAFMKSGAKPVFASEIEDYPIAVSKRHFGDEDEGIEGDVWQYLANQ